jgi:hypothetical protein
VKAKFKGGFVGIALIGCSVGTVTWFGVRWWPQHSPQDFEQCSAQVERTSSSKERMTSMAQCGKQFVGRLRRAADTRIMIFYKIATLISSVRTQHRRN